MSGPERTRKAKFMAVRISDVEVTFAPFRVSGFCIGFKSFGDGVMVKRVHVGDVEDGTTPPRPLAIDRLGREVEIAGADAEAGELVLGATVSHVEAKGLIKTYRLLHVVGGQGDSIDGFNHGFFQIGRRS